MEVREKLATLGWHVSNSGYTFLTEDGSLTHPNTVVAKALDIDIRDFGEAVLSSLQKQNRTDKIILQIQKIRNVASPKSKEDSQFAPRMLKIILTDGHTTCQAVEVCHLPFLSRSHTPPGSKLLVHGARIVSGCILLTPNCCELLGGRVPALCEKWELVKNISYNIRCVGSDGPPPWVNFGEKINTLASNEPFKALADKATRETTNEFDLHRQDAISSATTGAVKKVFGGIKQPLPYNNYSKHLNNQEFNKPRHTRGYKGKGDANEKVEKLQKPQEKVSLFDFLEDKLPANQVDEKHVPTKNLEKEDMKYNNYVQTSRINNFPFERGSKFIRDKPHNLKTNKSSYTSPVVPTATISPIVNPSVSMTGAQNQTNNETEIAKLSKNMTKISIDTQFAARSLKQHLNLHPNNKVTDKSSNASAYNWKIGDLCMAKYWEDGKYYNAVVTNLTQSTCVVTFNGYGNVEEVLKVDCIPLDVEDHASNNTPSSSHKRDFKGTREYHSNRRPYTNKSMNGGNFYYKS